MLHNSWTTLSNASLPSATLSNASLPSATLSNASLPSATLSNAWLPSATLSILVILQRVRYLHIGGSIFFLESTFVWF